MVYFRLAAVVVVVLCAAIEAGNIKSQLKKPLKNSQFTFYGAAGRGACGLDVKRCSVAASGQLFDSSAQWVPSTLPDKRYILNDPICKGICVKIQYNGKTAVFPVDNKCPECAPTHADLSEPAFLKLEPKGGVVGIAKGATLTYLFCNQTTISSC
ncbi:expansin-like protein [Aphelenchoides avenae]|nr:expansin-like protein [Aphelenchus avenae]